MSTHVEYTQAEYLPMLAGDQNGSPVILVADGAKTVEEMYLLACVDMSENGQGYMLPYITHCAQYDIDGNEVKELRRTIPA